MIPFEFLPVFVVVILGMFVLARRKGGYGRKAPKAEDAESIRQSVHLAVTETARLLKSDTDILDNEFQRLEYEAACREHARLVEANEGRWVSNPPILWDQCDSCGTACTVDKMARVGPFDYCKSCSEALSRII